MTRAVLSFLVVAAAAGRADATTIRVPDDQPTIQAGLDAAAPGDTVEVACGTWFEHEIRLASGVVLRSETGFPDCVTIDAQGQGRVLFGEWVSGATIEGMTLTGGYNDKGRIFEKIPVTAVPTDRREGLAPGEMDIGGGAGAYVVRSQVTFSRCVFLANEAKVHGGGIRCEEGETVFADCAFSGNQAGYQGGALYLGPEARATITRCTFAENGADQGAGFFAATAEDVFVDECTFRENVADRNGGALVGAFSPMTVRDCTFRANAAGLRGGAAAIFGHAATFSGCTLVSNEAPRAGAVLAHTAAVDVVNSIVAFHGGAEPLRCHYGSLDLTCCDVFGNAGGDWIDCVGEQLGRDGNFSADPRFCDEPAGDLGLAGLSPCLPENNSCQVRIGAFGQACDPESGVVLVSDPPALQLLADTQPVVAPYSVAWPSGSVHEIGAITPQTGGPGRRFDFAGWSDGGGIVHEIVVPPATAAYTATFDASYFLTMGSTGEGTVSPGSEWHPGGSVVGIEAVPAPGWGFAGWTGTGDGSYTGPAPATTVTMHEPISQTATFTQVFHPVTMIAEPGGSVSPPSGDYPENLELEIVATPDPGGWSFVGWIGEGPGSYTGPDSSAVITVLGPITQTAVFEQALHPVTMIAGPGGSVAPPSGEYPQGVDLEITATPDSGWYFVEWTGEGAGSYSGPQPSAVITVLGPITQTAAFAQIVFNVTITTSPVGKNVVVDDIQYVSPATFTWVSGSEHAVEVDSIDVLATGTRDRFTEWSDGVATTARTITATGSRAYTAEYAREHALQFQDPPEGQSLPGDGWYAEGTEITIQAIPFPGHHVFESWAGTGDGSYTGPDNPAMITMVGPITEVPGFRRVGYDFTISASASDPHVNSDETTGGIRELYFWLACSDVGIAAFEGDLVTDLDVQAFVPASTVFNVGTPTSLLLAIGGCPGQEGTPFLLGHWTVVDSGGDACLAPSPNGILGAVDCAVLPVLIESPDVVGFSSSGAEPCRLEGNACQVGVPLEPDGGPGGPEIASGETRTFIDAFAGTWPNPFGKDTRVVFSLGQPGHVRVSIYDVSGRLVRSLVDRALPPGAHETTWNGRSDRGGRMPAGVYFVRLEAGSLREARKLVLVRTR